MTVRAEKRIATAIIVLVLSGQFLAVIAQSGMYTWPFTDYPMYARVHHEGDRILAHHRVFATTADGEEVEISASDVGLNIFQFISWAQRLVVTYEPEVNLLPVGQGPVSSLRPWLKSTALVAWLKGEAPGPQDDAPPTSIEEALPAFHRRILSLYEERFDERLVRLRIEDNGLILTKQGMKEVPRQVLAEFDIVSASN